MKEYVEWGDPRGAGKPEKRSAADGYGIDPRDPNHPDHPLHTPSAASPSPAVRHALDRADLALQEVSRWTTHMPGVPLNEKVAALVNEAWEAVYAAHNEIRRAEA